MVSGILTAGSLLVSGVDGAVIFVFGSSVIPVPANAVSVALSVSWVLAVLTTAWDSATGGDVGVAVAG